MQTEFPASDLPETGSDADKSPLAQTVGITVASFIEISVAKICLPQMLARMNTIDAIPLMMGTILAIGLGLLTGIIASKRLSSPQAGNHPIAASIVLPKAAGESATLMPH